MDTINKYMQELDTDTKLDVFNVKDVQSKLPGIKHKWVGRLIRHKHNIVTLESRIVEKREQLVTAVQNEITYAVSKPQAIKAANNHESILKLKKHIKDEELIVSFLEKIERIFSSMTFDIKNLTEIMKLETM